MTNITTQDFISFIHTVSERLEDEGVYYVNLGGCGFFAVELAKRMIQIGMKGVGIRVFGDGASYGRDIEDVTETMIENNIERDSIHNWNDNGVDFAHIVVEWNGIGWDCEGQVCEPEWNGWHLFDGYMSLEDCAAISADSNGWNSCYDRINDNIVKEVLDECFELLV